jgi:hypothetical protein
MSHTGRPLPVVSVRDFFDTATCYAELYGRVRLVGFDKHRQTDGWLASCD